MAAATLDIDSTVLSNDVIVTLSVPVEQQQRQIHHYSRALIVQA